MVLDLYQQTEESMNMENILYLERIHFISYKKENTKSWTLTLGEYRRGNQDGPSRESGNIGYTQRTILQMESQNS